MRSRVRRCSRENSGVGWAGLDASRFADGLSDSLDIAFSPPGEDEGPAPALFRFAVDPGPEGDEVVERGNQRQQNHEPDGEPGNPVNRKNVNAVDGPLVPAAFFKYGGHRKDLHQHLELAQFARLNRKTFGSGNGAQPADQEL